MKILKETISWVGTVTGAVLIAVIINLFLFQTHHVEGSSMEPTLQDGDMGVVLKVHRTFNMELDYNDIVIIDSRLDNKHTIKDEFMDTLHYNIITVKITGKKNEAYWIKRLVGKAGDELEFMDGKVYRNGELLEEDYIKEPMHYSGKRIVVPEGHVFVMGDNRNMSRDSRQIGPVPLSNVIGKLAFKF